MQVMGQARSHALQSVQMAMSTSRCPRYRKGSVSWTGMVDLAVPQRHFDAAALHLLRNQVPGKKPPGWTAPLNHVLARPLFAKYLERQVGHKASRQHYPAPFALIDLWRRHGDDPRRMLQEEAVSCARLATTDTARNLVRVFFMQERIKGLAKRDDADCRHVHVIGAGVMGGDIAAWCALQGMTVTLQDREPRFITPALKRAAPGAGQLRIQGHCQSSCRRWGWV